MSWTEALSAVGTVASPVVAVWGMNKVNNRNKKKTKVDDAVDIALLQKTVKDLADAFNKETGGNSGGFREKLNGIDKKLDAHVEFTRDSLSEINTKVDGVTNEVSFIKGTLAKEGSSA